MDHGDDRRSETSSGSLGDGAMGTSSVGVQKPKSMSDVGQVILWTLDYESLYHENLRLLMERFVFPVRGYWNASVERRWKRGGEILRNGIFFPLKINIL